MMMRTALTLAAALLLIGGQASAKRHDGACALTSKVARKACRNEVTDDYWIAVGTCVNLSADDARSSCLTDAKSALKEALQSCGEGFVAREDLCAALGQDRHDPVIDQARFLSPAETAANPNPYLPLVPGTVRHYKGDGELITVTVTDQTRVILGVTTIVVTDVVVAETGGAPLEDTLDFFAQDVDGNVWYMGELSQAFENGEVASLEGSWRGGVDGAKPGIVMKAAPKVGDTYRQEFALGNAEDAAEVTSITASESVPAASCSGNCVVTREFTPKEPGAEENKYYAPGIGQILGIDLETGARTELIP
jgi:hypothetical protein